LRDDLGAFVRGALVERLWVAALLEVALRKLHDEVLDGIPAATRALPAESLVAPRQCVLAAGLRGRRDRSFVPFHTIVPARRSSAAPEVFVSSSAGCESRGRSTGRQHSSHS